MKSRRGIPAIACALLAFAGCASTTGGKLALTEAGKLAPCGTAPNCVSSDATGGIHSIEPIALGDAPDATWQALIAYLEEQKSFEIKVRDPQYLRAVARTRIFRFVDDVEFNLRPESGEIAMRSAARLGFSDFGKNRRRLEAVRQALADANVLASGG